MLLFLEYMLGSTIIYLIAYSLQLLTDILYLLMSLINTYWMIKINLNYASKFRQQERSLEILFYGKYKVTSLLSNKY